MRHARLSGGMAIALLTAVVLYLGNPALGQTGADQPASGAAPACAAAHTRPASSCSSGAHATAAHCPDLLPRLPVGSLTWIGFVVILLLTVQTRPLLTGRTIDGVVLALTVLLLAWRHNTAVYAGDPTGHTVRWWAYLLLTASALYWFLRGFCLLFSHKLPTFSPNLAPRAMVILVIAGLAVATSTLIHAPVSDASKDGLVGGICMADTGLLPYGDAIKHEARSPLLYMLHAGVVKMIRPHYEPAEGPSEMYWVDRAAWLRDVTWNTLDPEPIWIANGILLAALLLGLWVAGTRLHSASVGAVLVAITCFFPGSLEGFSHPEIMLPTVLVTWAVVCMTLPGVGGLLSMFLLVLAGIAWPWAWLLLLPVLAWFLRRGANGLGAVVGLLAGIFAVVVGATVCTAPTLPRIEAALASPLNAPRYVARLRDDGTVVIEKNPDAPQADDAAGGIKARFWKILLDQDKVTLGSTTIHLALPNGVSASTVLYREVAAADDATRELLQTAYREAVAASGKGTRGWVALRTLIEDTWKPRLEPRLTELGTWDLLSASSTNAKARWVLIRRITKVTLALLSIVVAFLLIRGEKPQLQHLVGGMLVMVAGTLLVSMQGAVSNWVWLMPAALAVLAVRGATPPAQAPAAQTVPESPLPDLGPAPRITVED